MKRLPIIGVIGSHMDAHADLAEPLGKLIAEKGYHLLTGGGDGIMRAVAKSYINAPSRKGLCIGIIPIEDRRDVHSLVHYTNPYIELPIITQLDHRATAGSKTPLAMTSTNILTSDVIVVLPGLQGTKTETSLALVCEKPVILFGHKEDFHQFPTEPMLAETIEEVNEFILLSLKDRRL